MWARYRKLTKTAKLKRLLLKLRNAQNDIIIKTVFPADDQGSEKSIDIYRIAKCGFLVLINSARKHKNYERTKKKKDLRPDGCKSFCYIVRTAKGSST